MKRLSIVLFLMMICTLFAYSIDVQEYPLLFYHEGPDTPELQQLRDLYDYDIVALKGETEFEQMNLLKNWIYENIVYGGAPRYVQLRNSLTIMDLVRQGTVMWCNNMSAVYMQAASSLGWTSRYMFFRNLDGDAHVGNDIWSNDYQKWIMMDVTWNIHLEKEGIPLSMLEIREEWEKNNGEDLVYVWGAGETERRYTKDELPIRQDDNFLYRVWPVTEDWISFAYEFAYVGRNNFFSHGDGSGANIWDNLYAMEYGQIRLERPWEFHRYPRPATEKLFHDVNRVDITLNEAKFTEKGIQHAVTFDAFGTNNYTPNFKQFRIQINDGEWLPADEDYLWTLSPGYNTLRVRIENLFGALGSVHEVAKYSIGP